MAKSIKFNNNNYIDSTGIVHNRNKLSDILVDLLNNIKYSLNEVKIGKWIDGKPLYRKVISTTASQVDLSSLNYDYITIKNTILKVYNYVRNPYYTSSNDYFRTLILPSKKLMIETSISSYDNWITVLEYTKTTD